MPQLFYDLQFIATKPPVRVYTVKTIEVTLWNSNQFNFGKANDLRKLNLTPLARLKLEEYFNNYGNFFKG